jgi:hypothetical protein
MDAQANLGPWALIFGPISIRVGLSSSVSSLSVRVVRVFCHLFTDVFWLRFWGRFQVHAYSLLTS